MSLLYTTTGSCQRSGRENRRELHGPNPRGTLVRSTLWCTSSFSQGRAPPRASSPAAAPDGGGPTALKADLEGTCSMDLWGRRKNSLNRGVGGFSVAANANLVRNRMGRPCPETILRSPVPIPPKGPPDRYSVRVSFQVPRLATGVGNLAILNLQLHASLHNPRLGLPGPEGISGRTGARGIRGGYGHRRPLNWTGAAFAFWGGRRAGPVS